VEALEKWVGLRRHYYWKLFFSTFNQLTDPSSQCRHSQRLR